jgi:hypothetical protein
MSGTNSATNDQVVAEQQRQAEDARQKEADRQARINTGLDRIKTAFEGGNIMATRQHTGATDLSGLAKVGDTANGLTLKAGGVPVDTGMFGTINVPGYGYQAVDQSGKAIYTAPTLDALRQMGQQAPVDYTETYDTGTVSPGFNDDFYNKYGQGITDYYTPQIEDQYAKAKRDLTYSLARAGTLQSTAGNQAVADLAKQDVLNRGDILNKADTGIATLKGEVADERSKAESQLYATENPDVAANQALGAVNAIQFQKPDLTPLGQLFNTVAVGGANAYQGYLGQRNVNMLQSIGRNSSTLVR